MACSRRSTKWLILLVTLVLCVYLPFTVIFTINRPSSVTATEEKEWQKAPALKTERTLEVGLQRIVPAANGSIDLVLRLNIQQLLASIDAGTFNNGEATSNPIPPDPSFAFSNEHFCSQNSNLKYIIYVHSSPPNADRRMNIRTKWANPDLFRDGRSKVVFIMGLTSDEKSKEIVKKEMTTYGDIVQGNFEDEYKNLTIKGILGLKWLSTFCQNAEFAIKADDDAFVNIFKLIRLLSRYHDKKRLVTCPLWKENSMPILRDTSKCMKWCVKYTEFPGMNYFPKYCAGLSFVLSRDIIPDMYHAASTTPFFWIDDVYITGLLLGKTKNVEYIDLLKNFTLKEKLAVEQYTDFHQADTYYISHIRSPDNMGLMWHAALQRLSMEELLSLTPSVYEQYSELKEKVAKYKTSIPGNQLSNRKLLLADEVS